MLLIKKIIFLLLVFAALTSCQKETINQTLDYKTLGTSANSLLSNNVYQVLKVEFNYMQGFKLDDSVIINTRTFLEKYLNKNAGVDIIQKEITPTTKTSLTLKEIVDIEKGNRTLFTKGNEISVHILITNSDFNGSDILATSYWNTSFCLFGKSIFENSGATGQVSRTRLFSILIQHEFGHLLGLVDQGSPMTTNHKDINNGAHCNNTNCLMYYGIETGDNMTSAGAIPSFDANCILDLKANGG